MANKKPYEHPVYLIDKPETDPINTIGSRAFPKRLFCIRAETLLGR